MDVVHYTFVCGAAAQVDMGSSETTRMREWLLMMVLMARTSLA